MIIRRNIYDFKHQNRISIEYDDSTMELLSADTDKTLENHPYFTIENTAYQPHTTTSNLWISTDRKIIPLNGVFPLFRSAK